MAKRKKYIIENLLIEKYAAEGKCLSKHEDKIVFVEGGVVPGDIVNVQVTKSKKDWAEAYPIDFIAYSNLRQEPQCEHFGICGGCKWQMLPYSLQLEYKEQQVKDQFKRIGHIDVEEYLPIKGCVNTYNYRNKLEFTFSNKQFLTKQQMEANLPFEKNVLGFHAPKFFDKVIDIFHCHLQSEPSNEIKNFIRDYALQNNYTFYDIKSHQGLLRNLIIRVASTNQILVNVIFAENDKEKISALLQAIQNHFPQITSLNYTINTKLNDTIYDLDVQLFYGKKYIEENLEKYTFIISPKSFFQTNPIQTVELYNVVKSFATCKGDEVLYDLYCGTGSIGIFLSDNVNKIIGVESVEDAITDARLNAKRNLLENTFFYTGDVLKICNNDFFIKHGSPDIIVIDPPRAGCHSQLLEKLLEIKCKKIIYVSCNPATQARDLQILKSSYRIVKSQAVDMFPHTHHIENVVLLQLN